MTGGALVGKGNAGDNRILGNALANSLAGVQDDTPLPDVRPKFVRHEL